MDQRWKTERQNKKKWFIDVEKKTELCGFSILGGFFLVVLMTWEVNKEISRLLFLLEFYKQVWQRRDGPFVFPMQRQNKAEAEKWRRPQSLL